MMSYGHIGKEMNEMGELSLSFEDLESGMAVFHLEEGINVMSEEVGADRMFVLMPLFDEFQLSSVHVYLDLHVFT